ncbi:spermidine synthase [Peribacillus asahii]|uniref:spermidine synthase n=1 Tax=Peribacillus asahii TaxID=228899 RepID=UPI0037FBCD00
MIDLNQFGWIVIGAGLVLLVEILGWLYWRFLGDGSIRDYVSEDEEPDGDYRIIKCVKTTTQRIALVENQGQTLVYANGDVMFGTTEDDEIYAEALIHLPMAVTVKRENILIIGGGGGITTREALKYPEVKEITTVDIDSIMMDFGKNLEPLVKFNKGALNHPKVRTVIEDGRKFIEDNQGKWDAIFVDIPEPSGECPELSRLFSREFFRLLKERLEPGGVINISCPSLARIPEYLWCVQATLVNAGFHVLPYHFDVIAEYEDDYGFCMAANRPLLPDDITTSIPTRFLSKERVQDMFHFPYNYIKSRSNNKIQTDHNLVLAEIVDDCWDD